VKGTKTGKSRSKANRGQRARGSGAPNAYAPSPDQHTAAPDGPGAPANGHAAAFGGHETSSNGHAAPPGSTNGAEANGSAVGTGQAGAGHPRVRGNGPGGRGGAGRASLKNWRVRSRLLLLIAIPTVTALVLGGVRIASATQSALAFQRAEERAVLAADVTQLVQQLETERDQTIYFIASGSSGRPGYLAPPPASKSAAAIKQYN